MQTIGVLTITKINSVSHLSGVGKLSTGLCDCG